jgi:hypothetical protein
MTIDEKRHALRLYKQVSALLGEIVDCYGLTESDALKRLYSSSTYKLLADESTKLWWYSIPVLFDIYKVEIETGNIANSSYVDGIAG